MSTKLSTEGAQLQVSAETDSARQSARPPVHAQFHSRFLPDNRDLFVYLPPDYKPNGERTYPVLYMQDGQNLFDSATADLYKRTWQFAQAVDAAITEGEVEPPIVVGIGHAGERRLAEYTPTNDWKLGGGEADRYGRMLVEELLPFIAAHYRIRPGSANTGLGGSSLGALAALYLGLKHRDIFGKLAVLSPSVWWNHRAILGIVSEMPRDVRQRPRIWLDVGDAEGQRASVDVKLLDQRLRGKGWQTGVDLNFKEIPGGTHDESAWARRVRPMLQFLFPAG